MDGDKFKEHLMSEAGQRSCDSRSRNYRNKNTETLVASSRFLATIASSSQIPLSTDELKSLDLNVILQGGGRPAPGPSSISTI